VQRSGDCQLDGGAIVIVAAADNELSITRGRAATRDVAPSTSWRRVLVIRSCRLPQFQTAVERITSVHPDAEIWALTHEAHGDQVRTAGAHHVIGYRAGRLNAWRLGFARLWRLRRLRFDSVVIPLVDDNLSAGANLLRLAAILRPRFVTIWPQPAGMRTIDRSALRWLAVSVTLNCPESIITLIQMFRAVCRRRAARRVPAPGARIRVLHVINSLGLGGAQVQFAELLNRTPPDAFDVEVLVLANEGEFSRCRLLREDVPISYVGNTSRILTPLMAISEHCANGAYDVVHTWLPLANMLGSAAARLAGAPHVIISIRSLNPGYYPYYTQWWHRMGDVLAARLADVVTVNAQPLVSDHARWAMMTRRRITVVHNGLSPDVSQGDLTSSRRWLRSLLGLGTDAIVVGTVGRLAIEKDQATFLRGLAALRRLGVEFTGVLVGAGRCEDPLKRLASELGLGDCVIFLGARTDARRIIAGLDVLALTSLGEGFPNVLLEAGLLGVPAVSSDVGGVSDLVTDRSALFPPGNPDAAAATLASTLRGAERTTARTAKMQARCLELFTADRMAATWLALYRQEVAR
jgi:glycosyltransferase involved in cell wall biosynthesis